MYIQKYSDTHCYIQYLHFILVAQQFSRLHDLVWTEIFIYFYKVNTAAQMYRDIYTHMNT
jgi:hypothetical protein